MNGWKVEVLSTLTHEWKQWDITRLYRKDAIAAARTLWEGQYLWCGDVRIISPDGTILEVGKEWDEKLYGHSVNLSVNQS